MDDTSPPGSPHDLLLRLAGRVDDDLLADARELVAVGEDGHALELVTAALAADGTALPPAVRAELVTAADTAHIDLDADAALAPAAADTAAHRFSASAAADVPVIAAARELPERLRDGIRLRLAWRQTPAGPAPTPLPHPVLLVESPTDGRPGEVLAYQMAAAMARSNVHVAVEVLTSGKPLTSYHAAALRDSTPLSPDAPPRQASPPEKVESVVAEVVEEVTASHRVAAPEERPVDLFAVEDEATRPVPLQAWQSGRRRRGFGEQAAEVGPDEDASEPTDHGSLPSPVPLARRTRPRAVGESDAVQVTSGDPLAGPLNQPLTDPLLDPIPATDEGTWTDEWASGDWALAEGAEAAGPPSTGVPPTLHAVAGAQAADPQVTAPRAATGGAHTLFSEPDDLAPPAVSGADPHAVGVSGQHGAAAPDATPAPPDGTSDEPTDPGTPVLGQRPTSGPAHALADHPTGPVGAPIADPPTAEALLRPEALARLSDEDRQLLTRLQAELAGGAGAPFPGGPNGSNGTGGGSNGSASG